MASALHSTPHGDLISLDYGVCVAGVIEHLGREGISLAQLQPLLFAVAVCPHPVAGNDLSQAVGVHPVRKRMQHLLLVHLAGGFQVLRLHRRNLSVSAQQQSASQLFPTARMVLIILKITHIKRKELTALLCNPKTHQNHQWSHLKKSTFKFPYIDRNLLLTFELVNVRIVNLQHKVLDWRVLAHLETHSLGQI